MDRLLKLIEEGDPAVILSEERLIPRFNELMKYDLVELKDERVFLTEKGKEAKREGVEKIIKREKNAQLQNSLLANSIGKKQAVVLPENRKRKFWMISLLLLILLAVVYIAIST